MKVRANPAYRDYATFETGYVPSLVASSMLSLVPLDETVKACCVLTGLPAYTESLMNDEQPYTLCEEELRLLGDALRSSGIPDRNKAESLGRMVEKAIDNYKLTRREQVTFRNLHDAFAALLKMANEEDPSIGIIRSRIKNLPSGILKAIEERGPNRWERLFEQPYPEVGFAEWSQTAPWPQLLKALNHLLSDGGMVAQGRKRPGGKRSKARLEPIIMGVARGNDSVLTAGHNPPGNGRPPGDAEDELVRDLGFAWAEETALTPSFAQTGRAGFGKFVHLVFSWLDADADQALRRFGSNTVPLEAFQLNKWVS